MEVEESFEGERLRLNERKAYIVYSKGNMDLVGAALGGWRYPSRSDLFIRVATLLKCYCVRV